MLWRRLQGPGGRPRNTRTDGRGASSVGGGEKEKERFKDQGMPGAQTENAGVRMAEETRGDGKWGKDSNGARVGLVKQAQKALPKIPGTQKQ